MTPDIAVLVPVYQRPHRIQPLVKSFHDSYPQNCVLLFIVSREDTETQTAMDGVPHLVFPQRRGRGDWAKKINWAYKNTTSPWLLLAADDVHFKPGWDTCLRRAWRRSGKRVLGTADLNPNANPAGIYSPHPLVARSYADDYGTVDRKGLVVCEDYDHNYPDRELAATAIARDEWQYVPDAVLEHLHPGWTETANDNTYRLGAKMAQRDYLMYIRRHKLWDRERRLRERAELLASNPR